MYLGGFLLVLLLFADDIALLAPSAALLQHLLTSLSAFCASSGLVVNLAKTCWLVGGVVPRG